jgi:hypothetical protein
MGLTGRDGCVVSTRALVLATIMALLLVAVGLPPAPAAADAPGDTVGIHRDGRFLLRHSNSGGAANRDFIYGRSGDEPLVGDWNGDGVATVGVRRGSQFFLRNSNSGGPANISFYYGRASDEVVVGDFNGDGRDTIGVRRGSEFHLRNSNSGGPAHVSFHFGRAGDEPLVGDWNGNGTATVGVRRGSQFFLRNSNSGGAANISFYYGRASDEVVVGDWNGNRTDTVGVRRGSQFHLRNSNSGGAANLSFYYGRSSDAPLAGRWTPPPARDQVIGEFTTPLVAGQSRNVNIHRALDLIDGDVIAPGATYSLNAGIGPRTASRGFVTNGAIVGGDLVSAQGGGVSQVGVTFLNAAWESGIEIRQFRPHSIYFQRYPMCRDATLGSGSLDVVVRNDSPNPIRIETAHTSRSATVRLIGTPWASVRSSTSAPFNVSGDAFSVTCRRTVTYPNGSSSTDNYSWRYTQGYPG